MSWLTRLKERFNKSQEEPAPVEEVDSQHESSPFAALIETPEETSPEFNANVKDVFVITDATPSEPDTLGIINPGTMEIRVRDAVSGEFNTVYRWQGPAIEEYIPIWGDWAGSGVTSLGLYHPGSGYFNLFAGFDCNNLLHRLTLDQKGNEWRPLAGDWDRDGRDGVGLYNPETGFFLLCNLLDKPQAIVETRFKNENHRIGDVAISGDWNGDGLDEVGVYNAIQGEFTLFESLEAGCKFSVYPAHNVNPEWSPLSGDWRGIGFDSIGLYDNQSGAFYLLNAADDQEPEIVIPVKKDTGYWKPFALKGFTAPTTVNDPRALVPADTRDSAGESVLVGRLNGLIKAKKYKEAMSEVERAFEANPTSKIISQVRGKAAFKLKVYDLAEISLQNALSMDADDIETLIDIGGVAEAQEKWDKALLYWDLSLPKAKERKQKFDVLSAKAQALIELKSYDEAEKIFQGLQKQFSGKPQSWIGLANVARMKGEWHAVMERLQECIERFPSHSLTSNWKLQRAECLVHLRKFEEALEIFSTIPGNHPGQIKALEAVAESAMDSKQWDRAIECFEQCASLLPNKHNKTLQYRLRAGDLMIKLGRHDEAETQFQKLAKLYPNHNRVKNGIERVRKMRANSK